MIFPAVSMKQFGLDEVLLDGGSAWNVNMVSGIQKCLEKPGINSDKQIVVDVISLFPENLGRMDVPKEEHTFMSFTPMALRFHNRAQSIKSFYGPHD